MRPHLPWSAAFLSLLVAHACIVGCSSSSGSGSADAGDDSATGGDAAGGADEGAADTGTGMDAGSVMDAGGGTDAGAQSCEASVLPPVDAGGACNACLKTNCMTELATCAADCVCGPIVACLELTNLNNYPGCNGLGAIESAEPSLMSFSACAADPGKCQGPCFSHDAGAD